MDDDEIFSDDPVGVYIEELQKIPALSPEEELECIARIRAEDPDAERRLVESNLFLVVSIAKRYQNANNHILDLIQAGNDGLLRAAQSVGEEASVLSFAAYATPHIERAIFQSIATSGSAAS